MPCNISIYETNGEKNYQLWRRILYNGKPNFTLNVPSVDIVFEIENNRSDNQIIVRFSPTYAGNSFNGSLEDLCAKIKECHIIRKRFLGDCNNIQCNIDICYSIIDFLQEFYR
jgi:hypothetical protein